MFRHPLRGLGKRSKVASGKAPREHRRRHWVLEGLENRALLSGSPTIYTVDLTTDTGTGSDNKGDLLYCITQANANTNTAGSEIEFDPTVFQVATQQSITLSATLNLSETAGPEVIDGPGASDLKITGNDTVEVFYGLQRHDGHPLGPDHLGRHDQPGRRRHQQPGHAGDHELHLQQQRRAWRRGWRHRQRRDADDHQLHLR